MWLERFLMKTMMMRANQGKSLLRLINHGLFYLMFNILSISSQMIKEMLPITNLTNAPAVTRQDLDRAIDAGDWAAVGATAALLSHQKDEHDVLPDQDKAAKALSITRSHMSDLDLQRAKELDHLVDTGDWEGIVLTAAKYESLPISQSDESASLDPTTYTFNASVGSDTYGNNRKRDEIRAEVEDLVRKVVPDEAENIDEMMRQFYGRVSCSLVKENIFVY